MSTTTLALTALAASALLALAACGTAAPAAPPTVTQIAKQIGATGLTPYNPPTLYASQEATGTWHGRSVDIAVFASIKLRDNWEAVAKNFAPILADGPDYAVAGD